MGWSSLMVTGSLTGGRIKGRERERERERETEIERGKEVESCPVQ